jgi:hypothetical protein
VSIGGYHILSVYIIEFTLIWSLYKQEISESIDHRAPGRTKGLKTVSLGSTGPLVSDVEKLSPIHVMAILLKWPQPLQYFTEGITTARSALPGLSVPLSESLNPSFVN